MSDDEHPMLTATGGDASEASGLGYFAAMLVWMTDCDAYELAKAWVRDVDHYTEPEAEA